MGQQMGKEAELPLICSMENPESGHTQRQEEEADTRKKHGRSDVQYKRKRYKKAENERVTTILFTITPYRAAKKRLSANLCLTAWSNNLFTAARGKKYSIG